MSNRERCLNLINTFSEGQLASVVVMLESVKALASDAADDAYCRGLLDEYHADGDKGELVSVEDLAGGLGITL